MSVYTSINHQQVQDFLNLYSLGRLIEYSGIQAGIENTNYRVTSSQGDFILTIFESLSAQDLPCYLDLLNHLSSTNFPAPSPQRCIHKQFINTLSGKPAAFFNCLPGRSIEVASIAECSEIGKYLANLHIVSQSSSFEKPNLKNIVGWQKTFEQVKPFLSRSDKELLNSELEFQLNYPLPPLPSGVIHADLFKDNVLFEKNNISGILDFYNACTDFYLFDIAVTCNDWCVDNNEVNQQKIEALLTGYQKLRKLNTDEHAHLTVFLRRAALRFWLSRLEHQLEPKQGELTLQKDPLVFRSILEQHRQGDGCG